MAWPASEAGTVEFVALLALAAVVYGFVEARQLRVEEVAVATPKRISGPLTLVQLSDMHLGAMGGADLVDRVVAKLREIKPDIVVATGDLVDGQSDHLDALAARFRTYTPALGAYAVTGNHETYAGLDHSLRFLRSSGFTVLRDEWAKAGGIVIAGVDDPSAAPRGERRDGVPASLSADDFVVLLKHQPVLGHEPFGLQLSGHVHGGQIFPFVYLTSRTDRPHPAPRRTAAVRQPRRGHLGAADPPVCATRDHAHYAAHEGLSDLRAAGRRRACAA